MTTTDGIVVDGRLIRKGDMCGPRSAQMVLQNPSVDTAVFEVARGGILREGLGYDRNDVAVVTNVTGDHLGLRRDRHDRPAGPRQVGHRRGGAARRARPCSTPTIRSSARMARQCAGRVVYFSMARPRARRASTGSTATAAVAARRSCRRPTTRRAGRAAPRAADDAAPLHAPDPGHLRRPGADERGQRAGRGRRRVGGRRAPARHPPGPAHLHHVVLPGARPAQRDRGRRLQGLPRLLPQRRRHAPADRVRRADDGEPQTKAGPDRRREGRSAVRSRDRRHRHPRRPTRRRPARVRRGRRGRVRRDHRPRGQEPARPQAGRVGRQRARGDPRGKDRGRTHDSLRQGARGDVRRPYRAPARRSGRPVVCCVDDAIAVYREAMSASGASRGGTAFTDPGELEAPEG